MEVGEERMEQGFGPGLSELGVCGDRAGRSPAETGERLGGLILGAQAGRIEQEALARLPPFLPSVTRDLRLPLPHSSAGVQEAGEPTQQNLVT